MISSVQELAAKVLTAYKQHKNERLFTMCTSGLDASGKGYITKLLQQKIIESKGYNVATINIVPLATANTCKTY